MKVILFGGAFNPVTLAHINLAKHVKETLNYDKVIFMPSKSHYILSTENKDFAFSEEERLKMLKEVENSYDFVSASDYELKQDSQPRTYFTLKYLSTKYDKVSLLIGSDWLNLLETKWMYVDKILDEFDLIVIKRNDDIKKIIEDSSYLKRIKDKITFIDDITEYKDISSSKVREYLSKNDFESVKKYVPECVFNYLERKKDYEK